MLPLHFINGIMIRTPILILLIFFMYSSALTQENGDQGDTTLQNVIPIISIDQLSNSDQDEGDTYSVLSASRDAFESAITFTLGRYRYRFRGYDGKYNTFLLNYAPLNDMVLGWFSYGNLGGLSNILYGRENSIGLEVGNLHIGEIGGVQSIDIRAGNQRKRFQGTYSFTNGAYNHRLMATYNTGVLEKGWAVSMSVSKRWAQEGYVEGTFYDTYGYYFGVEKFIKEDHRLALSVIANAGRRGRSSGSTQEVYDLAGSYQYNSYWGWQDGEKRNSRVVTQHQPIISLNYEWKKNANIVFRNAAYVQIGKYGTTALDWYDAKDPRPDYYRNLPSYIDIPEVADQVENAILENPDLLQLDWDYMYEANRNSYETVENANGIEGNTVSGKQAKYVLQERRSDVFKVGNAVSFEWSVMDRLTINGGLNYSRQQTHYFNKLDDLLGADFHVDVNSFAERDFPSDPDKAQNDLNNPNRIVYEGDTYGNNYKATVCETGVWGQALYTLKKVDFSLSAAVSNHHFKRTGEYRSGLFPENSFGDSKKQQFLQYQVKGGVTYKVSGKHYLFATGAYQAKAPSFRDAFVSPRTRNTAIPNLETEKIGSVEAGYLLKSEDFKARAVFYYTSFKDQVQSISFYHDDFQNFVNYSITNIGTSHIGVELMAEAKIVPGLYASVVAVLGRHTYNGRPNATITRDNDEEPLAVNQIVYADNYYLGGHQQNAATIGLDYSSPKYWRVGMDINYLNGVWISINPARRTADAIELVEYQSDQWNAILNQEKTDPAVTVDLNGGYSWKMDRTIKGMKKSWFMYLNVGLSNVLNKKDIATGGFEQYRFDDEKDPEKFPRKYYYAQGFSAYVNLSFRL